MTTFDLVLLASSPILVGMVLITSRPLRRWTLEEGHVVIRSALAAVYIVTTAGLGFVTLVALDAARRLLPNDDAEAPVQLIGVVSLVYAVISALVLVGVSIVAVRDFRTAFRPG